MLWTGGKDCALAMHWCMEQGIEITHLVTFVPPDAHFRAHPLHVMQAQVEAVGKPWLRPVVTEPHFESYRTALASMKRDFGVDAVITGDISLVDGHPNWIRQCAEGLGIEVLTPLWELDRADLLDALLTDCIEAMISAVRLSAMDESWVGRKLDAQAIDELTGLDGVDPCGENGEYHSIVLNAPYFNEALRLTVSGVSKTDEMAFAELKPR